MRERLVTLMEDILRHETMHPIPLCVKAQEELGEFAEAMLMAHGYLRHKNIKPELYGELADVFMVMITATALTDGAPPDRIIDKFMNALEMKFQKYYRLLLENSDGQ